VSNEDAGLILERANADFATGSFAEAARGFRSVIAIHPDVGELYINLGAALRAAGDTDGAEQAYRTAIEKLPTSALAWFNLANLLREKNSPDEALNAYRKADALQPGTVETLNNLGVQLYDMGAVEEALAHYDAALAARPDHADTLTNRGNALQRMGRMEAAEAAIEQALRQAPTHPVYLVNKASFLAAAGRHDEAISCTDKAIAADPGYTQARLRRASLLIQTGDIEAGFREYEARWEIPNWHELPAKLPMPPWPGGAISGKSLLLWNEQGFGDALMYARYIPILSEIGARITVMVERQLMRLFENSFPDITVCDLKGPPPITDFHAPMMSLPYLMGTTFETIPPTVPYLRPNETETAAWQDKIDRLADGKPAVGLVWAGNPGQSHDYTRSIPPAFMAPLLAREDVRFFNLLVGPRGDEIRDPALIDVRTEIDDFASTAALMQTLDLIVSVDSAPAHLAGALGRPLWVLLSFDPDSRYFLKSEACPWYPSAKLLRQSAPGGWAQVTSRANAVLDDFIGTKAKS